MKEVQELCESLRIPDVTRNRENEENKAKWKIKIEEAVERKNEREIKEKIRRYEKLEIMKDEEDSKKEYLEQLTLSEARTLFRVRTRMVKCKMNQSGDKKNKSSLWKCGECGFIDSQAHIIHWNSDVDVANYFKEVLRIRDGLNED